MHARGIGAGAGRGTTKAFKSGVKANGRALAVRPLNVVTPPKPQQDTADPATAPQPARPRIAWPAKRGAIPIVVDKVLDTVGDVALHARRAFTEPATVVLDRLGEQVKAPGRAGAAPTVKLTSRKPVVLILGSGWGAHACMKVVDTDKYELVVASPTNHFLFTPMLPSTAVGTVEFRSLLEDVRTANPYAHYVEAGCDRLDVAAKVAYCTSAIAYEDGTRPVFEIPYDIAVVAVGEKPATFGVPGVEKHAFFLKEVADAVALRKRIQECFELASLPNTSEAVKRRILGFVVVGGGPTGVEFAGTMNDFLREDLRKKYCSLMPYVSVTLLQSGQAILTQFADSLQQAALNNFKLAGVDVRLGVRVVGVTQDNIQLKGGEELPYGCVVWSTGNSARPLVMDIASQLPEQQALNEGRPPTATKLVTDPFMRVVGARDLISLGDCSAGEGERLPATAQVAAQEGAYVGRMINWVEATGRGRIGVGGLDQAPPLRAEPGAAGEALPDEVLEGAQALQPLDVPALAAKPVMSELDLLALRTGDSSLTNQAPAGVQYFRKTFEFLSLGIMAYIGGDKALTQVEVDDVMLKVQGALGLLLWKSVYLVKQVSLRNRVLILFDWAKSRVFGRDISQF